MKATRTSAEAIAHTLTLRILKGELASGTRLPPHLVLQRTFKTTPVTMHRAIQALVKRGFLRTQARVGIFVVDHPPHVAHFAIVFPWDEQHAPSQFYRAIEREAAKLQAPERRVTAFHGVDGGTGASAREQLLQFVAPRRLAGIIFANMPVVLADAAWLKALPRVGVMQPQRPPTPFPTVYPDLVGFDARACRYLAARGRRRVAVVGLGQAESPAGMVGRWKQTGRKFGLKIEPWWVHGFGLESAGWGRQVMELMFRSPPRQRPNALIVADDNFLEAATQGLAASGVRVPAEVEVVAMTNFPWPAPSVVPVVRLGFAIDQLIAACMDDLRMQNQGHPTGKHTAIPAMFESEVERAMGMGGIAAGSSNEKAGKHHAKGLPS